MNQSLSSYVATSLSSRSVPPRSVLLFLHTLQKKIKRSCRDDANDNENENGASFENIYTYTDQDCDQSTTAKEFDLERDKDQHYNTILVAVVVLFSIVIDQKRTKTVETNLEIVQFSSASLVLVSKSLRPMNVYKRLD